MLLTDGDYYSLDFDTPLGPISVLAEIHIFGQHVVFDELLIYPRDSEGSLRIGVANVLEIVRQLRNSAAEQGFAELTAVFHRVGPGRHGRTITVTRRLR